MGQTIYCDYTASGTTAEQLNLYFVDLPASDLGIGNIYFGQLLMPGWGSGSVSFAGYFGDFLGSATEMRANIPYPCGCYGSITLGTIIRVWIAFPVSITPPTDWEFRNNNDGSITPALLSAGVTDAVEKCYTTGANAIANSLVDGFIFLIDDLDITMTLAPTLDVALATQYDSIIKAYWGPDAVMEFVKNDPDITILIKNTYNPPLIATIWDATHGTPPYLALPFTETPC